MSDEERETKPFKFVTGKSIRNLPHLPYLEPLAEVDIMLTVLSLAGKELSSSTRLASRSEFPIPHATCRFIVPYCLDRKQP